MRSGLAHLELQATKIIERLESLKVPSTDSDDQQNVHHLTPGFLNSERKKSTEILGTLESLIVHSICDTDDSDDESSDVVLPPLDDVSKLALISNSIVAYLSHLPRHQLAKITSRIITDTNRWLSHIFRFIDCSTSYHSDTTECILRAVRYVFVLI